MEDKNQPTSKEGTEEGKWNKLGKLGELTTLSIVSNCIK
jgi:hypothetical protein